MTTRRCIELRACGPDDPGGLRTATILSAYFHAEETRAFRRLLWRRLAVAGVTLIAISFTTQRLSLGATVAGLALLITAASWAALLEWGAAKRLSALLADLPSSMRSTSR